MTSTPDKGGQQRTARKLLRVLQIAGFNLALLALLLVMFEAAWLFALSHPGLYRVLPANIRHNMKAQYMTYDRTIIQFRPDCARFDPELTYTLRPGGCLFTNPEFSVEVNVNSLGVRDDEVSLDGPEVIVLGDSYAMGWGVAQDETFAERIERATGMRTLNMGISSYGTAREVMMLKRADLSRLRVLIVQYNSSDYKENLFYIVGGKPSTQKQYKATVEQFQRKLKYRFGEHLYRFARAVTTPSKPKERQSDIEMLLPLNEAEAFLKMLDKTAARLEGVEIVAFDIEENNDNSSAFFEKATVAQLRRSYAAPIEALRVLDITPHLTDEHYFPLDDHINRRGHESIAALLLREVRAFQQSPSSPGKE